MKLLAVLEDKRKALEDERAELVAKAEKEGSFEPVAERLDQIDGNGNDVVGELPAVLGDISRAQAERKRIMSAPAIAEDDGKITEGLKSAVRDAREMLKTPSAQFLGSEEWTDYLAKIAPGGREISAKAAVESPKIPIEGSTSAWLRKGAEVITGGSSTSQGALMATDRLGIVDAFYQRPITLLDLFAPGTTDADVVEYVRMTSYTAAAAGVPEATHIDGADETPANASHKPWSEMALEKVTETVKTIAVGTPATRRALTNPGQMRQLIDEALRYDLRLELERQTVEGSGTGEELEGFATVANTQSQAFDTSIVLTLRRAITKVRTVGKAIANGIAMNPTDIDDMYAEALTSTAPGMAAILLELAQGRIHGKPIVEAEAIDAGSAWVADFRRAFLLDREQATIQATTGYMDFFMRNLVAILGEGRWVFGVVRPQAFVEADLGS